jgi:hypothetical protein
LQLCFVPWNETTDLEHVEASIFWNVMWY